MVALPFTFYVSWSHTTTPCSQTNSVRLDFWEMYTDPRRFTSNLRWLCTRARHEDTFKATFTLQKLGWMVNEMSCEECLLDMKMSHIYRMVHEFKSSFSNNIVIVSIRLATKYHLLSSDVYICSFLQLRKLQFFFGGGGEESEAKLIGPTCMSKPTDYGVWFLHAISHTPVSNQLLVQDTRHLWRSMLEKYIIF